MLDIVGGNCIATKYQIWDGALSKYTFQSFSLPLQNKLVKPSNCKQQALQSLILLLSALGNWNMVPNR